MSVEPKLAVDDASLLPALALGMAGAVGGMASLVVTYPLYTVTMQQQAHVNDTAGDGPADLSPTAGQVAGARPATAVAVVRRILRDEGWVGLFKGLKSALVANGIQSAVYYYFYAYFKRLHRRDSAGRLLPAMSALAAAEAGVASVLMTNPFWEVNMRQVTSTSAVKSGGFFSALSEIVANEGLAGLYRGVFPALLLVSVPMSQFWVYELSLRGLARVVAPHRKGVPMRLLLSPTITFLLGAWSKAWSTLLTFPLQTIRTLLVAASSSGLHTVDVTNVPSGTTEAGVRRLLEGVTGGSVHNIRLRPCDSGLRAFGDCAQLGTLPADGLECDVQLDTNTGELKLTHGKDDAVSPSRLSTPLRVKPVPDTITGRVRVVLAEHGVAGLFNGIETKLLQSPATAAFHLLFRLQIVKRLKQRYPNNE